MMKDQDQQPDATTLGIAVALGVVLGVVLMAITGNGIWLPLGVAIGLPLYPVVGRLRARR